MDKLVLGREARFLQGGVEFPTGGDGAEAHEPAKPGNRFIQARFGENPKPTVKVRMGEGVESGRPCARARKVSDTS